MADDAAAAAAAAATAAAAAAAGKPWYDGADAETVGYIQNRGLDKKTPAEAALASVKAHREAEKFVGLPTDQLIRVPTAPTDEAGWKKVWERLGAPAEAKGYEFTGLKHADGKDVAPALLDSVRASAAANHLPKDAATAIARTFVKHLDDQATEAAAAAAAALTTERATLKTNWANNYDAHMVVAKAGAAKLGITPEAVIAMEKSIGYAATMEAFRKVGALAGEDKFMGNGGSGGNPGAMTKEQAKARVEELKADTDWVTRYMNGGAAEKRDMGALSAIIAG